MLCLVGTDVTFVMSPYWDQMTLYIFDECYDQLRKLMRTLLEKKYINYWYFLDFPKNTLPRLTTQILEAASPLHQLCRIISPTCTGSNRVVPWSYPGSTPVIPRSYPGCIPGDPKPSPGVCWPDLPPYPQPYHPFPLHLGLETELHLTIFMNGSLAPLSSAHWICYM